MDLKIVSVDSDGTMAFNLKEQRLTNGIQQLLQEVSVELLSNFNAVTGRGSNLPTVLEAAIPGDSTTTQGSIAGAVQTAQAHVISNQQEADLEPDERLARLDLLRAHSDSGIEWDISVQVTTAAGTTAQTTVTL